jgi:hypothetical protein
MINVLAVWLFLSCCHSRTILTYELLSDVAGIQSDPAGNRCGGTDVLVHCAVRSVVQYAQCAGRTVIAFLLSFENYTDI